MKSLSAIVLLCTVMAGGCGNNHNAIIDASGTLEAVEVNVGAKVSGQLERMTIQEGSSVQKGDTLAVLEHSTLQLQWMQAKAGVDLADAQYRLLVNGARSEDLKAGEEALRQTQATLTNAKDDYERMKELFAAKSVSRKQHDDAESRYQVALAQYNTAQQNLEKLRNFARPEDLSAAKARLEQARATAELLSTQLSYATILAPVSGIITHKPVEVGELVNTGSTVVTIAQLSSLNLMIYVNENDLGKVKLGSSADVVIDSYPDRNFRATVIYISPIAEFTPKNIQTKEDRTKLVFGVKLEVANEEGILKAGMPADAYVH